MLHAGYRTLENHNTQVAIQQQLADENLSQTLFIFGSVDARGTALEKDLHHEAIVANDSVEKLLAMYPPDYTHLNPSAQFFIYTATDREVTIIAYRGFLVQARLKVKQNGDWIEGYFFGRGWRGAEDYLFAWLEFTSLRQWDATFNPLAFIGPAGVHLKAVERDVIIKIFREARP